ncbi:Uncharacterised protein [Clostridioides difficile]|nr:Uncharacterised protein [Clostridioides difficile]VHY70021.1 Uncharacterised protein [Clostridioides difficile]
MANYKGFILTIWNVNVTKELNIKNIEVGFILTIWNVNSEYNELEVNKFMFYINYMECK